MKLLFTISLGLMTALGVLIFLGILTAAESKDAFDSFHVARMSLDAADTFLSVGVALALVNIVYFLLTSFKEIFSR